MVLIENRITGQRIVDITVDIVREVEATATHVKGFKWKKDEKVISWDGFTTPTNKPAETVECSPKKKNIVIDNENKVLEILKVDIFNILGALPADGELQYVEDRIHMETTNAIRAKLICGFFKRQDCYDAIYERLQQTLSNRHFS